MESIVLDQEQVVNDQIDSQDTRSYECMYCKHGFTSAQALGGHMNVHRKDRAKSKSSSSTPLKTNDRVVVYEPCLITREFMSRSSGVIYDHNNNHGKHGNPNGLKTSQTREEMRLSLGLSLQFGQLREEESVQARNEDHELDLELRLGYDP